MKVCMLSSVYAIRRFQFIVSFIKITRNFMLDIAVICLLSKIILI